MKCPSCGQEIPKDERSIVEIVEERMLDYLEWTWQKLENAELPRLPWDVKNRGFATYGDRKK